MVCKVSGCEEDHEKHYCKLCKTKDVDHFSGNCPAGTTLYHGTNINVIGAITAEGLKASTAGRLGPGVYFVEKEEEAKRISQHRENKNSPTGEFNVVLKCNVHLGKHIYDDNIKGGKWQQDYKSASAMHPPWANINCF